MTEEFVTAVLVGPYVSANVAVSRSKKRSAAFVALFHQFKAPPEPDVQVLSVAPLHDTFPVLPAPTVICSELPLTLSVGAVPRPGQLTVQPDVFPVKPPVELTTV